MTRFSWQKFNPQFSKLTKKPYFWFLALPIIFLIVLIWYPPSPPPSVVKVEVEDVFTISYADSVQWLDTLPEEDRDDQIRDWALWGLAGILDLDIATLRNATYDRAPVRDESLNDVVAHLTGPGRAILDSTDTLHLLVPQHDPYLARSIGMTLDDFRKDSPECL